MIGKVLAGYKAMSIEVKAAMWFLICNVLQKGIQYITLPLFSRILSVEEYGSYTVFISWLSVIQIVATLNLSGGIYMSGLARNEEKRDEYSSAMLGISMLVALVVGITYFIFYNPLSMVIDLGKSFVFLIFVHSFFAPLFLFWAARERYELRYKELAVVSIVGAMASPIMSLALIYTLSDKVLAICIGYISGQLCMGVYCGMKQIRRCSNLYNLKVWKEAVGFSVPMIPHFMSYVVLGQVDRVMIKEICGQYEAGIYGLAYQLSNAMNMLTSALDAAFTPQIYEEIKNQKNGVSKKINLMLMFYALIAVGVALVAPEVLVLFGSQKYAEAKWVMPPIILSTYFFLLAALFMKAEYYFKKNKYITIASTTIALLNILLNYIFIDKYGYIVASYTTLVCYAGFAVAHYIFMKKTIKENGLHTNIFDIKGIVLLSVAVWMCLALVLVLYLWHPVIRYALVLVIAITTILNGKKYLRE